MLAGENSLRLLPVNNLKIELMPETMVDSQGREIIFRAKRFETVVPSATLTFSSGNLYVGVGGDVKLKCVNDTDFHTLKNVPSGTFIPGEIIAVHTDSTATYMLWCY